MRTFKIKRLDRRGEISAPIITVLLTVAALAVTGITITWMNTAASNARSSGAIVIISAPVISGNQLLVSVKNIGSADAIITNATLTVGSTIHYASSFSPTSSLTQGTGITVTITLTGTPAVTPGQSYSGSLLTNQGTITFSAIAQ